MSISVAYLLYYFPFSRWPGRQPFVISMLRFICDLASNASAIHHSCDVRSSRIADPRIVRTQQAQGVKSIHAGVFHACSAHASRSSCDDHETGTPARACMRSPRPLCISAPSVERRRLGRQSCASQNIPEEILARKLAAGASADADAAAPADAGAATEDAAENVKDAIEEYAGFGSGRRRPRGRGRGRGLGRRCSGRELGRLCRATQRRTPRREDTAAEAGNVKKEAEVYEEGGDEAAADVDATEDAAENAGAVDDARREDAEIRSRRKTPTWP